MVDAVPPAVRSRIMRGVRSIGNASTDATGAAILRTLGNKGSRRHVAIRLRCFHDDGASAALSSGFRPVVRPYFDLKK